MTGTGTLTIRRVGPEDAALLFEWANDPAVRANSFCADPIECDEHTAWFTARLNDANTVIWILEADAVPVGQVRYQRDGDDAIVSVSIRAESRGRGYGDEILGLTSDEACHSLGVRRLIAFILEGNTASRGVFLRAGYREIGSEKRSGRRAFRLERSCT